MFRGRDIGSLQHLFRDILQNYYDDMVTNHATEPFSILNDYYTAIAEAIESAGDNGHATLYSQYKLYQFKFYWITKVDGINSPYVIAEWPGIHLLHAILSLLDHKEHNFTFINDAGEWEEHTLQFYDRNPAGRNFNFDDSPGQKQGFVRYAVEFQ